MSSFAFSQMLLSLLSVRFLECNVYPTMKEPNKYILSFPTDDNHLGITIKQPYSLNYFIVLGDWGANYSSSKEAYYDRQSQSKVAQKIKSYIKKQEKLGKHLLFFVIVGDNFYNFGLDCNYLNEQWIDIYGDLTKYYYWFSTMGNHDWGNSDKYAMCPWKLPKYIDPKTNIPYSCNQLIKKKGGCVTDQYYMPDYSYYYTINELNFELIVLEENSNICPNKIRCTKTINHACNTYKICGNGNIKKGKKIGCRFLNKIRKASEKMFRERARVSTNKNFLFSQHYGSEAERLIDRFYDLRVNDMDDDIVVAVYGHRHDQRCERKTIDVYGNKICELVLTGGGGGCCADDNNKYRGFFVMEFDDDKHLRQPLKVRNSELAYLHQSQSINLHGEL